LYLGQNGEETQSFTYVPRQAEVEHIRTGTAMEAYEAKVKGIQKQRDIPYCLSSSLTINPST